MVTLSAPSRFDCTAASTAVMPPPITTTRRPTGSLVEILGLPEFGDIFDGVDDIGEFALASEPELVGPARPDAEEHRVDILAQLGRASRRGRARRRASTSMPPIESMNVDLARGEIVRRLVGGDAVFVEAAGFSRASKIDDLMARDASACAQARPAGPAPTIATRLPVGARARERLLAGRHLCVDRVALQLADAHRLALGVLAHAGFLASFSVGQTRAHMPPMMLEDEDRSRRAERIAGGDLADEQRNVDRGRAGALARRVEAEIAAVGFDMRLVLAERRMQIGEIRRSGSPRRADRRDVGDSRGLGDDGHDLSPMWRGRPLELDRSVKMLPGFPELCQGRRAPA